MRVSFTKQQTVKLNCLFLSLQCCFQLHYTTTEHTLNVNEVQNNEMLNARATYHQILKSYTCVEIIDLIVQTDTVDYFHSNAIKNVLHLR